MVFRDIACLGYYVILQQISSNDLVSYCVIIKSYEY
jgi:hypothetical protein